MSFLLNEKQWRQYLALESKEDGSILGTAKAGGEPRNSFKKGILDTEPGGVYTPGSGRRRKGGGAKPLMDTDPTFVPDIEALT